MSGVYLSAAARDQIRTAQDRLDRHVLSAADERCLACGVEGPCEQRRAALRVLGRYGMLPARRPGATHPELIGRSLTHPGFAWLPASTATA